MLRPIHNLCMYQIRLRRSNWLKCKAWWMMKILLSRKLVKTVQVNLGVVIVVMPAIPGQRIHPIEIPNYASWKIKKKCQIRELVTSNARLCFGYESGSWRDRIHYGLDVFFGITFEAIGKGLGFAVKLKISLKLYTLSQNSPNSLYGI